MKWKIKKIKILRDLVFPPDDVPSLYPDVWGNRQVRYTKRGSEVLATVSYEDTKRKVLRQSTFKWTGKYWNLINNKDV